MSQTAPAELATPPRALPVPPGLAAGVAYEPWGPAAASDASARAGAGTNELPFDEGAGAARATEHDRRLREALDSLDLRELCQSVADDARARGVCFGDADASRRSFASTPSRD